METFLIGVIGNMEYCYIIWYDNLNKRMTNYAEEGWELVSHHIKFANGGNIYDAHHFVWKRVRKFGNS